MLQLVYSLEPDASPSNQKAWQDLHSKVHSQLNRILAGFEGGGIPNILSGTTGSIGGAALAAGAVASGTVTIPGVTTSMVAQCAPNTYPGDGFTWNAQVTAANTVTVRVIAVVAGTPNASTFNVRVLQ